jgi:hypothetical protein
MEKRTAFSDGAQAAIPWLVDLSYSSLLSIPRLH